MNVCHLWHSCAGVPAFACLDDILLACWVQQVDVIAAHEVLRHANDGSCETGLSMVVG